jgi:hypothetical protein
MDLCATGSGENSAKSVDQTTTGRLAAIENHIEHIESLLVGIGQLNSRLDRIYATLELAIGLLAPGQHATNPANDRSPAEEGTDTAQSGFRVVAHISRPGHGGGARLVSDVSWSDMWSVRLYVTALLRNLARTSLIPANGRCWCEIWIPNEAGELVDSAFLDQESGVIEWESDLRETGGTP